MQDLQAIGTGFNCDKFTVHHFGPQYEHYLGHLRDRPIRILEIGIGGGGEAAGGESLKTWAAYFSQAQIFGIDLFDKSHLDTDRIKTIVCDQSDQAGLAELSRVHGPFDVVIDDGSHKAEDTLRSLFALFNLLVPGGFYVIEDIQTSYWPQYSGTSIASDFSHTTILWIKRMIDVINADEILWSDHPAVRSGFLASELHIHHNIAFVRRGEHRAQSSILTEPLRRQWLADDLRTQAITLKLARRINDDPRLITKILRLVEGLDEP